MVSDRRFSPPSGARDPSSPSSFLAVSRISGKLCWKAAAAVAAAAGGGGDGGSAIIYEVGRLRVGETVPSARPSHPLPHSSFVCVGV